MIVKFIKKITGIAKLEQDRAEAIRLAEEAKAEADKAKAANKDRD